MPAITKAQSRALARIFSRNDPKPNEPASALAWWCRYRTFRRSVVRPLLRDPCIMVRWADMWLGIEPDGHVHS